MMMMVILLSLLLLPPRDKPWPIKSDIWWWFASIVTETSFRCFVVIVILAVVPSLAFTSFNSVCVHVRASAGTKSSLSPALLPLLNTHTRIFFIVVCICCFGSALSANNLSPPRCELSMALRWASLSFQQIQILLHRHNNATMKCGHLLKVCFRHFAVLFRRVSGDGRVGELTWRTEYAMKNSFFFQSSQVTY